MEIDPANTWEPPPPVTGPVTATGGLIFKMDTPTEMVKSRIVRDGVTYLKIKQIGPVGPVELDGRKTMVRLWICVADGSPEPAQMFLLSEPVS